MCNCPGCGWKVYTEFAIKLACPMCRVDVECEGKTAPVDMPINPALWPAWAKLVRSKRQGGEIGVGDTFQRLAKGVGGEVLKKTLKTLGIPCGCDARRDQWNELYPYPRENFIAP